MKNRVVLSDSVLADLHADLVPEPQASRLRLRVRADPEASAFLDELDATVALLNEHGQRLDLEEPMPTDVAGRVTASLLAAPPRADASRRDRFRRSRRSHRLAVAAAVVGAMAVATGVVVASTVLKDGSGGPVTTAAPQLGDQVVFSTIGTSERGRLADPTLLAGCLAANGLDPNVTLVGSGTVTFGGVPATLLVTAGDRPGAVLALAVGDRCGPGVADTVSRREIG